jgi:hypothetical protein
VERRQLWRRLSKPVTVHGISCVTLRGAGSGARRCQPPTCEHDGLAAVGRCHGIKLLPKLSLPEARRTRHTKMGRAVDELA